MNYDAITLDTNVFDRNGLNLKGGILLQLNQFKDGPIGFWLSDVVLFELRDHLLSQAKVAHDDFRKACRDIQSTEILEKTREHVINEVLSTLRSPNETTKSRIETFVNDTGAQVIPSTNAKVNDLVKMYFLGKPPFKETGKKKFEFPDAIALLSLESLAKDNNYKILAVSNDEGWSEFAKSSHRIDVVQDLVSALAILQGNQEEALRLLSNYLKGLNNGIRPDSYKFVENELIEWISRLNIGAEADSSYELDPEYVELTLESFQFEEVNQDEFSVKVIKSGSRVLVAACELEVSASAACDFGLSFWDSVDKESIGMGSVSASKLVHFNVTAIIEIQSDTLGNIDTFKIVSIEFQTDFDSVDFGTVEPDWGADDEDDELDYDDEGFG